LLSRVSHDLAKNLRFALGRRFLRIFPPLLGGDIGIHKFPLIEELIPEHVVIVIQHSPSRARKLG